MAAYVALLRAINVAGHGRAEMRDVRRAFEAGGCRNVRTLIQSGNVVFDAPTARAAATARRVRASLGRLLGDEPVVVIRTIRELQRTVEAAPFDRNAVSTGVKLYVAFLARRPRPTPVFPLVSRQEALEAIAMAGREVFIISRRKPNGFFGLPNNFIEGQLGVTATTRNWSTVNRILALARAPAAGAG